MSSPTNKQLEFVKRSSRALQISARKTERRPEKKHGIPPF